MEDPQTLRSMRRAARAIFMRGVAAVDPSAAVKGRCRRDGETLSVDGDTLELSAFRHIWVVGAGKASAAMAAALEEILEDRISGGIVTVKHGYTAPLRRIRLVEAGHPVADENGMAGAEGILALLEKAGSGDLVFCLISGGGSALLPLPAGNLSLADKQETFRVLSACGATIHEMNTLRKHLSRIKGGQLARAAWPATLVSLMLSDVVGDDVDVIASGPTVPDGSTYGDCLEVIGRHGIGGRLPGAVRRHLEAGAAGKIPETPKAGEAIFGKSRGIVVGSNIDALVAAGAEARRLGYRTLLLSSMVEGETRCVAAVHCAVAREILRSGHPVGPPACVLTGGETTVTIRGRGKGGRSQEFSLAAAMGIADAGPVVVLCAGTDGTDGPTEAAGAFADTTTVSRARGLGMEPRDFLTANDSYRFFEPLGDLFVTGPTNTNVMDLRIVLVGLPPGA